MYTQWYTLRVNTLVLQTYLLPIPYLFLEMFCPPGPGMPLNGNTFCSDENVLGSKCNFTCEPEFELLGSSGSDCIENANGEIVWSDPVPECKRKII